MMTWLNKIKRVRPDTIKDEHGLTITIPTWMLEKYGLDISPHLYIECKREGILLSKLDLFP